MSYKKERDEFMRLASYQPQHIGKYQTWYVQLLPGDGGKDWGWTTKREQAKPITQYWQRRFMADSRRCNWFNARLEEL